MTHHVCLDLIMTYYVCFDLIMTYYVCFDLIMSYYVCLNLIIKRKGLRQCPVMPAEPKGISVQSPDQSGLYLFF